MRTILNTDQLTLAQLQQTAEPLKIGVALKHLWLINGEIWFCDPFDAHFRPMHKVEKVVYFEKSPFQEILFLDIFHHGRVLILGGYPQMSSISDVYREIVGCVVVLLALRNSQDRPIKVAILGGGDGDILKLLCLCPLIEEIVLVDIDEHVDQNCRAYLPEIWDDILPHIESGRVKILNMDAAEFVKVTDKKFGVVIIDLVDPNESTLSLPLMQPEFFEGVKRISAPDAYVAMQSGQLGQDEKYIQALKMVRGLLRAQFSNIHTLRVDEEWFTVPWSVTLASDLPLLGYILESPKITSDLFVESWCKDFISELKYLNPRTLLGSTDSIHPKILAQL